MSKKTCKIMAILPERPPRKAETAARFHNESVELAAEAVGGTAVLLVDEETTIVFPSPIVLIAVLLVLSWCCLYGNYMIVS